MIKRGNHKPAKKRSQEVEKALSKDVIHRFSMPILVKTIQEIPGARVQPFGVAEQLTLSTTGERVHKYWLTQDLSFLMTEPKLSVNSQIDMEAYLEMIYRWCLHCTIHYLVALHPHK
jgi:hypothetical protein